MLSMRAISRAAPRAAARLTSSSTAALRSSAVLRPAAAARPSALAAPSWSPLAAKAFSSSATRRADEDSDVPEPGMQLSTKLAEEIKFETEIRENEPEATAVKDFVERGLFEIEDVPGREDVVLRRTYQGEKITVTFSVADLTNYDPELYDTDSALADEEHDEKLEENEDADAEGEGEGEGEGEAEASAVPFRVSVIVEKPGKAGALSIDATAQDGTLLIDNLYYYQDAALAHEATPATTHAAQRAYPGPAFGSLDEDLQTLMEMYLEERGIDHTLAVFIPEYLDAKEQREYLGFLKNVKGFVEA